MASNALRSALIRHIGTRNYAQAAPAVAWKEVKLSHGSLPNKIVLAALDNGAAVTRITVAFKAGSRFECQSELGLSHVLRSAAGFTTGNASSFIMARKLAQVGATVTASGDREFVYYTLETTSDNLDSALECLRNLISNQEFRQWELNDNVPRLKYDIAAIPPQVRAVDLLHKAAYRRGLGNSLFIAPKKIGKVSSESMQHYAATRMTPARCAVAVVGAPQERACMIGQALNLGTGSDVGSEPGKYYGGELRKETGGDMAHVAVAVQGAAAGTPQALALAVAAKALGNGPVTKWGSDLSPLAKAIGNVGPFAAAGFNVAYSDSGLFGVVLSVPKDEAQTAIKSVAKVLKTPAMSPEAINAGKNQLKVQILSEAEEGTSLAENLAAQCLYTGTVKSPGELAARIDQISPADITGALANATNSPISMGSVGNLAFVPYVDELLL